MVARTDGSSDMVRAEPGARRRALAIVLTAGVLGSVAIQWLLPWSRGRVEQAVYEGVLPQSTVCKVVLVGLMSLAASVGAFGVHAYRYGRRVIGEERFPPAGTKVVRDTRVLHGRAARALGRAQAINGALLVVLAVMLFALCAYGFLALTWR